MPLKLCLLGSRVCWSSLASCKWWCCSCSGGSSVAKMSTSQRANVHGFWRNLAGMRAAAHNRKHVAGRWSDHRIHQREHKLTCRNEGRSPAWIENIRGRIEIFSKFPISEAPKGSDLAFLGPMEPLGAGKERSRVLQFICSGHAKKGEHFSVYVLVEYRDIFGIRRETTLGYSVVPDGIGIYRQEALPERNRNT